MQQVSGAIFVGGMDRPVARRWVKPPALIGVAMSATALATIAWITLNPADRALRVEVAKITIAPVVTAPFHDFIPLRGQLVPLDSVVLDAVQGGRVEEVLVEAGQKVVAGQKLIRLSDPQLELDAIARETAIIAQINTNQTQQLSFEITRSSDIKAMADAEYNVVRLSREVGRRRPLAAAGFESLEKLDQSTDELTYQTRLRALAADALQRDTAVIKRANALIEQTSGRLEANLVAAKGELDALTVRAPADGVLTGLDAHVGEEKTRGQRLGQIDRERGFKVTIQVDEFFLTRIKTGQHVAATLDGRPCNLVVAKVYPQVKDRKFDIDLAWESAEPPGLRRGQAVEGKLELGDEQSAVILPAGPFLETSGGAWAFVVEPDGASAARRPVRLGRRTIEAVEVLGGLKPGERVVISDYAGLDRIDRLDLLP